ncbi:hypothetical protein DTO166G4_3308 [Paecilomyces variotii]|nr:hypothetical protein DTO166G4_3308 [Paecilomyces variotii]KAJ9239108.1 hypothetical protein DTO166G5_2638 [Paecilomyces variotii]KAJ9353997.1 hypothetical protein DTO027B9_4918 [Paecilomyces variotii]KAJ9365280.1 hypothetical protein DTO280E4_935 [Paecilomyces variotii]
MSLHNLLLSFIESFRMAKLRIFTDTVDIGSDLVGDWPPIAFVVQCSSFLQSEAVNGKRPEPDRTVPGI